MAISKVSSAVFVAHSSFVSAHDGPVKAHWEPNTDVYVTDHGLVIKVELAGVRRENLEIIVEGHRVHIRGERPDGSRAPQCKFLLMSINYGPFETLLELPAGYDLGQAKAAYLNGFLRIDVPLAAPQTSKRTKVNIQGAC